MYKKLRRKIMMLIITMLILLWSITLGIIYFSTSQRISSQNKEMLSRYAKMYWENGNPQESDKEAFDNQKFSSESSTETIEGEKNEKRLRVSTFFSVAFTEEGTDVTNDHVKQYSNDELIATAEEAVRQGKQYGTADTMIYMTEEKDGVTLVVLMDNTVSIETMNLLIHHMIIFGGLAFLVMVMASYLFSGWIIKPLEENDERQRQFISDAGHELKTPISTINANMELLQRDIGNNPWLSNIAYENDRMERIVKELLDLAKSQDAEFVFEEINFSRLVLMQVMPFEASAFENGLELDYDVADDVRILGNQGLLQRLVSTLIDNAFTHCKDRGKIEVHLRQEKNHILFTVANEGEEIPKEERERIFDRFYRSDDARNGEQQHYGLGLSIAKSIVERHHGKIYVICEDGWTKFCVELKKRD